MKLNLAGGPKHLEGYVNVDSLDWGGATDVLHDLNIFPYPFEDSSVEEILSQETLEHLSFRVIERVLSEFYRILQPGGLLHIQVPDIEKMMRYFMNGEICPCVPRKAKSYAEYVADPNCPHCHGKAKIHSERWLFAFTGAQKHEFDLHRNIFTPGILGRLLRNAGFVEPVFEENIYKIIAKTTKPL